MHLSTSLVFRDQIIHSKKTSTDESYWLNNIQVSNITDWCDTETCVMPAQVPFGAPNAKLKQYNINLKYNTEE